jgi:O-antigen/teichoic acid export membrane protein
MGVLEVLQISSTILLISYYFGDPFPGYFYLTWRVLQAPINLISNNAYLVNYHHCSELKTKSLPYNKLIIDQFKILFGIAIIISFVIFLFGKEIFSLLLGENFSYSGQLAGNLVVLYSMQFAINPFSFVAILENKQRELLIRYGAQFLLNTLCFVVLANLNFDIEITLTTFSVLGAIFHAYNFYWYFKLAKNEQ